MTRAGMATLRRIGACSEAIAWARAYPTLQAAWDACERGDWMLWLAGRVAGEPGDPRRRKLVRVAAEVAESAIQRVADEFTAETCIAVVQACVAWSEGEATDEELAEARSAAAAAAADAAAAAYAAAAAAYAAAAAAHAATAAADVAYAATAAADVADADAADAADARSKSLKDPADLVRRYYPEVPR